MFYLKRNEFLTPTGLVSAARNWLTSGMHSEAGLVIQRDRSLAVGRAFMIVI